MKQPQVVLPQVQPDPAMQAVKAQAEADKLDAITDRVSNRTTDLLLRFGARSALSGSNVSAPLRMGI